MFSCFFSEYLNTENSLKTAGFLGFPHRATCFTWGFNFPGFPIAEKGSISLDQQWSSRGCHCSQRFDNDNCVRQRSPQKITPPCLDVAHSDNPPSIADVLFKTQSSCNNLPCFVELHVYMSVHAATGSGLESIHTVVSTQLSGTLRGLDCVRWYYTRSAIEKWQPSSDLYMLIIQVKQSLVQMTESVY